MGSPTFHTLLGIYQLSVYMAAQTDSYRRLIKAGGQFPTSSTGNTDSGTWPQFTKAADKLFSNLGHQLPENAVHNLGARVCFILMHLPLSCDRAVRMALAFLADKFITFSYQKPGRRTDFLKPFILWYCKIKAILYWSNHNCKPIVHQ